MSEVQRLAGQLKNAFEGEAWHGPSVREVLDGVTAKQAAARPIASAHNIWEIVAHMAGWEHVVARRALGQPVDQPEEGDWPAMDPATEDNWRDVREHLEHGHKVLTETLQGLTDAQLDQPWGEGKSTRYVLLHGIVQHNLYHAGQIAVLKRAVEKG